MKNRNINLLVAGFLLCFNLSCVVIHDESSLEALNDCNVEWHSPSKNSLGSMPMGNGDLGINLWVEENGDLLFYISKTDAWSENARLLKLGKVRLSLNPNPFYTGNFFKQKLNVKDGCMSIEAGKDKEKVSIDIWVDANHPVVELDVKSSQPIMAEVKNEPWRVKRRLLSKPEDHSAVGIVDSIYVEKDSIMSQRSQGLAWMHRNIRSVWKKNLKLQDLDDDEEKDPLLNRTFGCLIHSNKLKPVSDLKIKSPLPVNDFTVSVYAYTLQSENDKQWITSIENEASKIETLSRSNRIKEHKKWWNDVWKRSYIYFSTADSVTSERVAKANQAYTLQRYINICGGRGNFPIKFNGSIFTVDTKSMVGRYHGFDADYRQWGGGYWWQNTRLPYWSMLESGDFEFMRPLFNMYKAALPLRQQATQKYYNHEGAFYPETMFFWGSYLSNNYGTDRSSLPLGMTQNTYIRYYWQGGLELSLMMLDYYAFTQDKTFLENDILPIVTNVITFFDQHWQRDENGKIRFDPAMALETYKKAVNPLPEIVGIHKVCEELLNLPDNFLTETQREQLIRLKSELPDIPFKNIKAGKVLAPAQSYEGKQNVENPELYSIFPYRRYGIGKDDIELAKRTFENRNIKETGGWQQNAIHAACLGLTEDASQYMLQNFNTRNSDFRFPTMWGPNYDWIPDQDHGTVAMITLQKMLLQYDGDVIHLFPAWPKNWDVSFRLYAPGNTIIEGVFKQGEILNLKVTPESRKSDIICYL